MKLSVVFAVLCYVIVNLEAATLNVRSRSRTRSLEPKENEISLRLLPPALPHDHHHHNHYHNNNQPASNAGPNNQYIPPRPTQAPATTKRPTSSGSSSSAEIVKYEYENLPDGGYRFLYETSDGQKRNEVGYFRDDEKLGRILNVRGSYEYIDTNGKLNVVRYVADENGYRQEEGAGPEQLPANSYQH